MPCPESMVPYQNLETEYAIHAQRGHPLACHTLQRVFRWPSRPPEVAIFTHQVVVHPGWLQGDRWQHWPTTVSAWVRPSCCEEDAHQIPRSWSIVDDEEEDGRVA